MSCSLCTSLSAAQLTELNRLFRGGVSIEELCIQFQSTPEQVHLHCYNCIDISTREKLEQVLKECFKQLDKSRIEHETNPKQETAYAYTSILREARELSKTLDAMRSDEETLKELLEKVLFPLVRDTTGLIITELRTLRDTTYTITEKHEIVDQAISRAGARASQRLKDQQEKAINAIAVILNVSTNKNPLTEHELVVLQGGKK